MACSQGCLEGNIKDLGRNSEIRCHQEIYAHGSYVLMGQKIFRAYQLTVESSHLPHRPFQSLQDHSQRSEHRAKKCRYHHNVK